MSGPFTARIERLMKVCRWSNQEAASRLGVAYETLRRIRTGQSRASVDFVKKLATLERTWSTHIELDRAQWVARRMRMKYGMSSEAAKQAEQEVVRLSQEILDAEKSYLRPKDLQTVGVLGTEGAEGQEKDFTEVALALLPQAMGFRPLVTGRKKPPRRSDVESPGSVDFDGAV